MNIERIENIASPNHWQRKTAPSALKVSCFVCTAKIFAYLDLERPDLVWCANATPTMPLTCATNTMVSAGAWHWNKRYWNEIHFDADVPEELILHLIDHSLSEVLKKLPKRTQAEYAQVCLQRTEAWAIKHK